MSTPAASTKSVNSTVPEAQNATSSPVPPSTKSGEQTPSQQQQENGTEEEGEKDPNAMDEEGYPPQKHAGAIGLGPEYGKMREATTGDKVVGIKDEIVGKITRNQDKAQHGHEQRTGELKRKKFEEDNNADPFATAEGGGEKEGEKEKEPAAKTDESTNAGNEPSTGVTGKRGPGAHPTEKGAQEQAATTAPEGTDAAEEQRAGENTYNDKQIDESANKKPRTE